MARKLILLNLKNGGKIWHIFTVRLKEGSYLPIEFQDVLLLAWSFLDFVGSSILSCLLVLNLKEEERFLIVVASILGVQFIRES